MAAPDRKQLACYCLLLLLTGAAARASAAGEYRTAEVAGLRITMDSEWAPRTTPGYLPVRFDITNLAEAREIELAGEGMRFFRTSASFAQTGFHISQIVRLSRGDRVRLTIPVPIYADSENFMFEVREGENTLERFNYTGFASKSRPEHASVLIVADTESAFGKAAAGWPRPMASLAGSVSSSAAPVIIGPSGPVSRTQPLDFVLPPSRLPSNWLGFTSLRAVMVGPTEWDQMTDVQRTALLTWTACGGDLLLVDWKPEAVPALQRPVTAAQSVRAYFFGRMHLLTSASVAATGLSNVLSKVETLQDANWSLPANRATDWGVIAARGFRLPIPGVHGVPARTYFFILIVFSVLIGPVNYWLLWRSRQQVLLVLTTPVISALFIVLLAGYVVAGEGIGVRARAVTFTMLDQVRKQAATRASMSLYAAGMAPSGGLRFARDEAVFALGPDGSGGRESQSIDLTETQRFAGGVIQARSPTNLETIGFRPARERLGFEREAGGISVINGLGVTIRALIYRTNGNVYQLTVPLRAGHKALLTPGAVKTADIVAAGLPLSARFDHLFQNPPDGSYLAVVERSPYWNPGVPSVDERDSFHVIIGWIGGQP